MVALPRGYTLEAFDPDTASADLWARYHAYRRSRQRERRPEDPIPPDADHEVWIRRPEPDTVSKRWLVRQGDDVVGLLTLGWVSAGPMLETNRHLVSGSAGVLVAHRRRGIGRALARVAADEMLAQDRTVFTTGTEEDDGRAFLAWLGAEAKLEGSENRLDLRAVDWEMVEAWAVEGPRRSPGTTLVFWPERIPEAEVAGYAADLSRLLNTVPKDDLDQGEIILTPEMVDDYQARITAMRGSLHTMVTREPDGAISGITDVSYLPGQPDRIHQQFTGVDPDHRGRGLGKWLKAAMLLHIRDAYPDVRWIITGNANSNDPMLAINHRLGFTAYQGNSVYQIGRDALVARLAADG